MTTNMAFLPALSLSFAGGQNQNEDRAVCADCADLHLLAAFDGCGGVGGRRYPHMDNHTSAYLASGLYADCLRTWFYENAAVLPQKDTANALTTLFSKTAKAYQARHLDHAPATVTGSMVRTLPSTTVIALYTGQEVTLYWAGDTRGYLLTAAGLRQLTKDDLALPCDALDSLYTDAPISNYLCADRPFALHEATFALPREGLLLLATDGAFHGLPTPMHFEALLLNTLCAAASQEQWIAQLQNSISACAADDVTLLLQPIGFTSYPSMRHHFDKRRRHVHQAYILPAEDAASDNLLALRSLWEMYQRE